MVVSPKTCQQTSPVGFETEGKQEEGANSLSKIFVSHLLSSLWRCELQFKQTGSCVLNVYGASGLVIFRWIEIIITF